MNPADIEEASKWAAFYRLRGMNPLPSRPDDKRPWCRFAQWWDSPVPEDLFEKFPTSNVQIIAGRSQRLLAIDLDGDEAKTRWSQWGRTPATWITHSGGGGWHLWFRLPADHPEPLPKAFLWRGEGKHEAVERLCDRSLVMAPPSIHPETGERYRFLDPAHSPRRLPLPADCPAWVLRLKPIVAPSPAFAATPAARRIVIHPPSGPLDRRAILDGIPDKVGLARSWGLRLSGRPTQRGWWPCHAIDREDANPSAAIHQESGYYKDQGSGLKLSFFDLGVHLGIYSDWRDAATDLGAKNA